MKDEATDEELAQQVSEVLSAFSGEIMRSSASEIMHLMRSESLSMPRVVALMYVDRLGAASISGISDHLNLSLGTASHIVDQLVGAGYVSRTEDPSNRRLKQVTLTASGHDFVVRFRRTRVDQLARRLAELPRPLLESTLQIMTEITEYLQRDEA